MKTNIYIHLCGFLIFLLGIPSTIATYKDVAADYNMYTIRSALSPVLPMVITASSDNDTVTLQKFTGGTSQLWRLENGAEPGTFFIISVAQDNYALAFDSTTIGAVLHMDPVGSTDYTEHWIINSDGHIVSSYYNKHITVNDASSNIIGHNLTIEDAVDSDAQKFYLTKMN